MEDFSLPPRSAGAVFFNQIQAVHHRPDMIVVAAYGNPIYPTFRMKSKQSADGVRLEVPGHKRFDIRYRPALNNAG